MNSLVDKEERVVAKGLTTLATLVGFFCRAAALRNLECGVLTEGWLVFRLPFNGMLLLVKNKSCLVSELFSTFATLVGFLTCVSPLVINKRFLSNKSFPTLLTQKSLLLSRGTLRLAIARCHLPEVFSIVFLILTELSFSMWFLILIELFFVV